MQPHVCEVCRHLERRLKPREVEDAVRRLMLAKKIKNFSCVPGLVAKLKCVAMAAWQRRQEGRKTLQVHLPFRRELKQDRAKLALERVHRRLQTFQCRFWVLQLLVVRYKPAALHRKAKVGGNCIAPGGKRFGFR